VKKLRTGKMFYNILGNGKKNADGDFKDLPFPFFP
jgi:hypothetical protein